MVQSDFLTIVAFLNVVIGAAYCFAGYRIFKIILALTGFILGGILGFALGLAGTENVLLALLTGLAVGTLAASLLVALYFVGIFFLGAAAGALVTMTLLAAIAPELDEQAAGVIALILGIAGGIGALFVQKFAIIVSTAFSGAWSISTGVGFLATNRIGIIQPLLLQPSDLSIFYAVIMFAIVLTCCGIAVQYHLFGDMELSGQRPKPLFPARAPAPAEAPPMSFSPYAGTPPPLPPTRDNAVTSPELECVRGQYEGMRVPIDRGIRIGRDPGLCNLVLHDPLAHFSKLHVELTYDPEGGYFTLRDCGSRNGTFGPDGGRVPSGGMVFLRAGDTFRLVDEACEFRVRA